MNNKKLNKINNTTKGFTLIEIMVAITVFSLVMVVSIGAVLAMVSANKKSQAINSVITNLNFALEGMVRDIRTGFSYDCDVIAPGLQDFDTGCGGSSNIITFYSVQSGKQVTYEILNNHIYKTLEGDSPVNITGSDVNIDTTISKFYIKNTTTSADGDYVQPKVIIVIKGAFIGFGNPATFNLQTTVSQRRLDI